MINCFHYNILRREFVPSFLIRKEALKIPAENTKESETSMLSSSPTHDQSDNHEAEGMKTFTGILFIYLIFLRIFFFF